MNGPVVVVEMMLGVTTWAWLCESCIAKREASDWAVRRKNVVAWGCDDCSRVAQAADGYRAPTLTVAPTSPHAFAPAPGWKPDAPMKPWPHHASAGRHQRQTASKEAA